MEVMLLRPEVFEKLYNCSYKLHKYNSSQHLTLSVTLFGSALLMLVLYIPCVYALLKPELLKHSCYKIMLFMAINDIASLLEGGILSGVFGFWNISFCHSRHVMYVVGCIIELTWHCQTSSAILLAFNRCVLMLNRKWAELLFEGKKTWIWIFGYPFAYGVAAFVVAQPLLFSSEVMLWLFNPHAGYIPDVNGLYVARFHTCNNIIVVAALPTIYGIFGIVYYFMSARNKDSADEKTTSKSSLQIFYQIGVICFITVFSATVYALVNYVVFPMEFYYFTQILWVVYSGSPCVVYLTMNATIRRILKDFFRPCNFASVTTTTATRTSTMQTSEDP